MNKILGFEPITEENREATLALKTAPGQEGYIETVKQCLREAAQTPCWRPVLLLDLIRKEYGADIIHLSVIKENTPAIRLYQKFGFSFNGEIDPNGEAVMTAAFS